MEREAQDTSGSVNSAKLQGKRTISISVLLPAILALLLIAAMLPVALVGYLGTQDLSRRLLRDRSELLTEAVVGPIQNLLTPIASSMDAAANELSEGSINVNSKDQLEAFIQGILAASDHIGSVSIVATDGTLRRWSHHGENNSSEDGSLTFRQQLLADAATGGGGSWSRPFLSEANKEFVVTYRTPIRKSGQPLGLLTAAISLNSISESLKSIRDEFDVVPFLLSGREVVIAHPYLNLPLAKSIPTLTTVNDPAMAALWTAPNPLSETDPLRNGQGHWSVVNGISYTYIYRALQLGKGADLIAGYYMTSVTTRRDRLMRYYVAGLSGILLIGACAAATVIGRRLAKPMKTFGDASIAIGEFRFGDFDLKRLSDSRVEEIAGTASALTRMSKGLELFQRYVPRMLVRQLIILGDKSSQPIKRSMTVMFLDLEGYTKYSTGRNADEVASYLNAMFGRIGPIIEASGGTIDKYTGDGLMAFWGAPSEDLQHAGNALNCAFMISDNLTAYLEQTELGRQDICRIRMGLHSGEMVVGDLGYDGRIDYTVVGEVVNRAKRVESALRGLAPEKLVVMAATEITLQSASPDIKADRLEPLVINDAWRIGRADSGHN